MSAHRPQDGVSRMPYKLGALTGSQRTWTYVSFLMTLDIPLAKKRPVVCGNSTVVYVIVSGVHRYMAHVGNFRDCLGSYDPHADFYTSTEIDNAGRSWTWIVYVESYSCMQ